jgi:hypothetical protein
MTTKAARSVKVTKPAKLHPPKPSVPSSRLAEPIPDEAAIQELLASLDAVDQSAVNSILDALEEHFGSSEAARIWMATISPEFGVTPLEAIRRGQARLVKAVLEGRWGPNPVYA